MQKIYAMACTVVNNNGEVLLLKRALDKQFFPNKWAVVGAGPLNSKDNRRFVALREIKDELGVEGKIIKDGGELVTSLGGLEWHIHTFLATISSYDIKLNNEHTEYKWVKVEDLKKYDLLPDTEKMILKLIKK